MNWRKRILATVAALGLAVPAVWLNAGVFPECSIRLNQFSLDPGLLVELYNEAAQHDNNLTQYPPNMNPNVLGLSVTNSGPEAQKVCIMVQIKEGSKVLVTGGPVQSIQKIQPGETRVLNAADFETGMSFSGSFDQQWFDDEVSKVADDPSKVSEFLNRNFKVCTTTILNCDGCSGGTVSEACTTMNLLRPPPGVDCGVAMLIMPHNTHERTNLPNFVWTPAFSQTCPANAIEYRLVVNEGNPNGPLVRRIDIPAGQTAYQWKASDPALKKGVKYFWHVEALCNGKTFCGPQNRGWNISKWFDIVEMLQDDRVDLQELAQFVEKHGNPDVKAKLTDMLISGVANPQDMGPWVRQLLNGSIQLKSIKVNKK